MALSIFALLGSCFDKKKSRFKVINTLSSETGREVDRQEKSQRMSLTQSKGNKMKTAIMITKYVPHFLSTKQKKAQKGKIKAAKEDTKQLNSDNE